MRWFTADLHLGHANIINYADRPFYSVDGMNEELINGWNERVAPDDEVWVLGDFALGRIDETLPLVGLLAGRISLVAGNHDRCWPGRKEWGRWVYRYQEAGFAAVYQGTILYGRPPLPLVLASHFPYAGDSGPVDRFVDSRPADHGDWLLHGHVHDTWRQRGRQINVGVDAWAGVPVSEDALAALIADGPNDLAPLPWD